MDLIKPPRLKKDDTIALIAPSSGLAGIFPHRLDRAIAFLESEGYRINEFSATRTCSAWQSAPAQERAQNIMDAFLDKNVHAQIFFLEIPEGQDFTKGEPLSTVDAYLADLKLSGVFDQIRAMIVGRPFQYDNEETQTLKRIILERTATYSFPILFGADIGHTDPQLTIPLGVKVKIDSQRNMFEIIESAVQ